MVNVIYVLLSLLAIFFLLSIAVVAFYGFCLLALTTIRVLRETKRYLLGQIYCKHCGKNLLDEQCFVTPTCPHCSKIIEPDDYYCPYCLHPVHDNLEAIFSRYSHLATRRSPQYMFEERNHFHLN